jgi:hypothetical protein
MSQTDRHTWSSADPSNALTSTNIASDIIGCDTCDRTVTGRHSRAGIRFVNAMKTTV